ncbi:MAG: guanylate kinase [Oscillospiraceae bacterium]|nr:guanylate kinase [Oscillospiraceae bacterium]
MTKRGVLIVVSGPSGVGKDSVLRMYMPGKTCVKLSISSTTRIPRQGEVDGEHYNFVSREVFEGMIARHEMLEYAEYAGNYYGTPKKWVEDTLASGKHVILEVELIGALKIRALTPEAVFVFLMPPSLKALEDRLIGRGTETIASIDKRMKAARNEILHAGAYDYIVVNHTLQESCEMLDVIINAAALRTSHQKDIIGEVINHA